MPSFLFSSLPSSPPPSLSSPPSLLFSTPPPATTSKFSSSALIKASAPADSGVAISHLTTYPMDMSLLTSQSLDRDVEDPYRYSLHGYHPIDINQNLPSEEDPRYHVVHKLGYGSYSTVWLAYDLRMGVDNPSYVALKVLTADAEKPDEEACILKHLTRRASPTNIPSEVPKATRNNRSSRCCYFPHFSRPSSFFHRLCSFFSTHRPTTKIPSPEGNQDTDYASSYRGVLPLLDEFNIVGPNGTHRCFVTPVAGPSVANLNNYLYRLNKSTLPVEIARSTAIQLVKAVACLHSEGVVHGDLHVGNITLGRPILDGMSPDELYKRLGSPRQVVPQFEDEEDEAIKENDNIHNKWLVEDDEPPIPRSPPQYAVPPIETSKLWDLVQKTSSTIPINIIDFGEAWLNPASGSPLPSDRVRVPGTPLRSAPPEILILHSVSEITAATDIWTLACTIYELFGGRSLFRMMFGDWDEVISDVVCTLGKPSPRWWEAWKTRMYWFTDDGKPAEGRAEQWQYLALKIEDRVRNARKRFGWGGNTYEGEDLNDGDVEVLVRVLQRALKYEPSERPTAQELLEMLPKEWAEGKPAPFVREA